MNCPVRIAILGFGNIGSGVAQLAASRDDIEVKYILDVRDFSGHELESLFVADIDTIINDDEVSAVVETIGGINPALDFTRRCLEAKKSVVTSNKALVAECGTELMRLASDNGVSYLFEASVGGAMPTVRPMLTTLAASEMTAIYAVLNGTTNFMLTRMLEVGIGVDEALKIAQDLGYAETGDPSDDVDGVDAKRKLAILASIAAKTHIPADSIPCRGIRGVRLCDLIAAKRENGAIKLVAHYEKKSADRISIAVEPMFVRGEHKLCSANDVNNALVLECSCAGETAFFGRGAGKLPTAGAVISDLLEAASGKRYIPAWTSGNAPAVDNAERCDYLIVSENGHEIIKCLSADDAARPGGRAYRVLNAGCAE